MAREGDPFNGLVLGVALGALYMVGDYETALEGSREALRLDPSHVITSYSIHYTKLYDVPWPGGRT